MWHKKPPHIHLFKTCRFRRQSCNVTVDRCQQNSRRFVLLAGVERILPDTGCILRTEGPCIVRPPLHLNIHSSSKEPCQSITLPVNISSEREKKKRIEETGWRRQPSRQPRKLAFQFRNHHYVMSCCCLHCDKSESQYYRWFSFLFLVSLCIVHIRHWWRQASFFFLEKSSDKQQDLNTLIIFQRTMTGLSIKLYTYEIYLYS